MSSFRPLRGANLGSDGSVTFSVWAPKARRVELSLPASGRRILLEPQADGVFEVRVPSLGAGTDYCFVLDGGAERPDPMSRFQPSGVHGPSRVVDPNEFSWTDAGFAPREITSIYELHVGTFSPAGTFDSAIEHLNALVELGVDAIEIMPVAEFPGARNWGYDGALLYAPQSSYGGPEALRRLVDACHARGLSVLLDVVYNHIGPEGNYLGEFGPYFSARYRTPWGDALNFDDADSDEVRRYFIENALYWLAEFHVDGLRLDAVHAIFDFSAEHVLAELAREFHALAAKLGRRGLLIAESDLNDTRVTRRFAEGGWELDAQWSDDFHHSLHALATGAEHGYFADFGKVSDLAKALSEGFVYDGRRSQFRRRRHGHSSAQRAGSELCVFSQNHDQIANASHGRRQAELVPPATQRLIAAVLAFAPNRILLFQGQEWGETSPFHYFTSHSDPELARAVQQGRKSEFADFGAADRYRDPQDERTFLESKLDWNRRREPGHAALFSFHQELLALRRTVPALSGLRKDQTRVAADDARRTLVVVRGEPGQSAVLVANFSDREMDVPVDVSGSFRRALHSADSAPPETLSGAVRLPALSAAIYLESR